MSKIMLIRHAEKPYDSVQGVAADGSENKEELIVQGWQRAGALVRFFDPNSVPITAGLAVPDKLYASDPNSNSKSLRPEHTVLALAAMMSQKIDLKYGKGDEKKLAEELVTLSGTTLVAWQHEDIPDIVNHITGNKTTCPQSWPDDRFDIVWVLDGSGNDWSFSQVPQMLLAGDSETPIPF